MQGRVLFCRVQARFSLVRFAVSCVWCYLFVTNECVSQLSGPEGSLAAKVGVLDISGFDPAESEVQNLSPIPIIQIALHNYVAFSLSPVYLCRRDWVEEWSVKIQFSTWKEWCDRYLSPFSHILIDTIWYEWVLMVFTLGKRKKTVQHRGQQAIWQWQRVRPLHPPDSKRFHVAPLIVFICRMASCANNEFIHTILFQIFVARIVTATAIAVTVQAGPTCGANVETKNVLGSHSTFIRFFVPVVLRHT